MHEHLGLNLDTAGLRPNSTSGILSPPQTQQQRHQSPQAGPSRAPPPPPPPPSAPVPRLQLPSIAANAPPRVSAPVGNGGPPAVGNVALPIANGGAANGGARPPPAGQAAPHPDPRLVEAQAAELVALRARLAQLEAGRGAAPPPPPIPPVLFAEPDTIDRARAAAIATKDGDKKPSLPDVIPGFKANSLDVRE
jgi:hypothetical protein